ncbi:MAG: SH3 domain-containing protein [Candidatus Omnitrophica bacterium]|nr:SH3 domain-containing protein [Candidatus Omnitrophota bacterium]
MRKIIFVLVAVSVIFVSSFSLAQEEGVRSAEKAFYRANLFYEAGDYQMAIEKWRSILAEGLESGNLYYNLANAYFKKGELGESILNYERAKRFMPRDSDLLLNLRHAKSLMKRPDPPEKKPILFKWLDMGMVYFTLKQSMILAFLLYYLLAAYIIMTRVFKRYAMYSTIVIITLCLVLIMVIIPTHQKIKDLNRGAVITAKITDAKFEPLEDAAVHFPIYEGMKVHILREKDDWYKIKRPDGKIGWVQGENLGKMTP